MKKRKNILCVVLAMILSLSAMAVSAGAEGTGRRIDKEFYEQVSLGGPMGIIDAVACEFGVEDGKNMMYIVEASRPTATFFVYNLDEKKVERSMPLQASASAYTKTAWYIKKGPDGNIYILPHGYILLYRYNVTTKELQSSGTTPIAGMTAGYGLVFDEEGNIYFGTFPTPNIYKCDKDLNIVQEYSNVFPGERYVMSMAYYNGKIYAGGQAPTTSFVSIDVKTGEVTKLKQPEETYPGAKVVNYYMMDSIDNLIFCTTKNEDRSSYCLVYDADKGDWVLQLPRGYGFWLPPYKGDGKTYVLSAPASAPISEVGLYEIDLETMEARNTETYYYGNLVGCTWMEIPGHPELPGESLITFSRNSQALVALNMQSKQTVVLDEYQLPFVSAHIQHIELGLNNTLLMGSYMGEYMAVYNPKTGETVKYRSNQSESIKRYGNIAYLGGYTQATLYEYDLTQPPSDTNPVLLGSLGDKNQDRIFDICKIDENLIAVGSYPRSGFDTGGIGIFDKRTGQFDFYADLFPGQSVDGLAYKDGILYGATSTFVPVTPYPANEAYIFAFDVEQRKVTLSKPVQIDGTSAPNKTLGDIEIGPDGNLWGISSGAIFCLDPVTLDTIKSVVADKMYYERKTMSTMAQLEFDKDGVLYAVCNGYLIILDPETMEFNHTWRSMQYFVLGDDGNIYHSGWSSDGFNLYKLVMASMDQKSAEEIKEAVGNGIVMKLDSNVAYANQKAVNIDSNDPKVVAKEKDGRTLVPVRFIAEAVGAKVDWDGEAQTVTIVQGRDRIKIVLGESKLTVNGEEVEMDTAAITENDRTMLPLRAICEALGKFVFWDDRGLIVLTDEEGAVTAEDEALIQTLLNFIENDVPAML